MSWYCCCSGGRLFPHGPFSPTRSRAEPCSLLTGAPAHGGRKSFSVRAKWETERGSCLPMTRLRRAITSRGQRATTAAKQRPVKWHNTTSERTVNLHPPVNDNPEGPAEWHSSGAGEKISGARAAPPLGELGTPDAKFKKRLFKVSLNNT